MSSETLALDQKAETYGYGVLNVRTGEFISQLDAASSPDIFRDQEALLEFHEELTESLDSTSHLRIVEVSLHNTLDMEAAEVQLQETEQ